MRKLILISILMTSFSVSAQTWDCSPSGSVNTCTATLDDNGKLTISGSGPMKDYQRINCDSECTTNAPWKSYDSQVRKLEIHERITSIGYDSFEDMVHIQEVSLPKGLETIKGFAFHSCCAGLQNLTLPDTVKSIGGWSVSHTGINSLVLSDNLKTIGANAFGGNTKLKSLIIPENVDSLDIEIFSGADAYGKTNIKELYCSEKQMKMCLATAKKMGIIPIIYEKIGEGCYIIGNMKYASLNDIVINNGVKIKRIYTIDEANAVAGKTNTFSIRYR